jgi:bifunctional isochorismate lyase/aryl carrier protein
MTLPAGLDYEPPIADLPVSRAPWQLQRDRAAVLVHDLQRYFARPYVEGSVALGGALASTGRILTAARAAGVPVFYTAQRGDQDQKDRGLQRDLWGPGMRAVPEHTDILEAVAPAAGDTVLVKHRYSAFARSDFAERLASAARSQLVITGVYAHIGITATAFDAFQREIKPFVVTEAVADFSAEAHRRALEQVASCSGVVTRTDDVIAAFSPAPSWDSRFREALVGVLADELVELLFAQPDADWFALGLDSLRAFEFLDRLADEGLDLDFGDFTRTPTLNWLREQADRHAA